MVAQALERPPDEVRLAVREALTQGGADRVLNDDERREIARSLVRIAHAARLLDEETEAAAKQGSGRKPRVARAMTAEEAYGGSAVANMADTARRTIQAISFPRFVAELIQGVFRAMVETNQVQLQQYLDLIRGVSQSLEGFASLGGGGDDAAKRWLADQFPASYAIEEQDPEDIDPEDGPEPIRLITRGSAPSADAIRAALGTEADAEVPSSPQELVGFVKRSLARNRQGMLATMIQMGMQRIVIDAGRIHASMRFHIDASSAAAEQAHTGFDTRHSVSASASGGWGIWSASAAVSSTIGYVRTTDTQTEERTNASADLNSSVELQFRTDQVPLDRLASSQTVERLRLNTLNPERELELAGETDQARIAANQAVDTARASRERTELAPDVSTVSPTSTTAAPTRTATPGGSGGRSGGGGSGGSGGSGSTGTTGTGGSSGTTGSTGTTGSSGTTGSGSTTGAGGSAGTTGSSGSTGSSGTTGSTGTTGSGGSSGTTGSGGTTGTTGTTGSSGTTGSTGTTGTSGTAGSTGTSGTATR